MTSSPAGSLNQWRRSSHGQELQRRTLSIQCLIAGVNPGFRPEDWRKEGRNRRRSRRHQQQLTVRTDIAAINPDIDFAPSELRSIRRPYFTALSEIFGLDSASQLKDSGFVIRSARDKPWGPLYLEGKPGAAKYGSGDTMRGDRRKCGLLQWRRLRASQQ